ncbi:MAG TPA: RluA family pseudouridine synthase [Anaerolineales bacterium]
MQEFKLVIAGRAAQRLDQFLAGSLPQYSRSRLQGLIRDGHAKVNGAVTRKPGQVITAGAEITLHLPPPVPSGIVAENIAIERVYEDADVIIVDKPAGMVVHPGAGHASGTLVNAALAIDPEMEGVGGEERPGVVHRLDKDTSGLIVLAKNDAALHRMQVQFQERRIHKTYIALVDGEPPTRTGRIEAPIGRDPNHRKQMAVVQPGRGREAVTEYSTIEPFPEHTLLELHPITGRTHQIRLHCAMLGCPVAGDTVYGRKRSTIGIDRHFLHAWKLEMVLPSEATARTFEAPLPDELQGVLAALRQGTRPTAPR